MSVFGPTLVVGLKAAGEILLGIYLAGENLTKNRLNPSFLPPASTIADLISGIVHMYLDYQEVKDRNLRLHVETSISDVTKAKQSLPITRVIVT